MEPGPHKALTIDQFTRQAIPFAQLPGHSTAMDILIRLARPSTVDEMLDVACGPGLVACRFAPLVRHVTGLDLTPEMIRQAEQAQTKQGYRNMRWQVGDAEPLPFPDESFTLVVTRYSVHHFQHPAAVLSEMIRVCRAGGRILVADVSQPIEKVEGYDEIERLRDPSHVHALSRAEFAGLFSGTGLRDVEFAEYKVEMTLEQQLGASFPVPGGADRIRKILRADVGVDRCGVAAHWVDADLYYAVPIVIATGIKPNHAGDCVKTEALR